jgi:uncharacterized protein (TIGR02117 family)
VFVRFVFFVVRGLRENEREFGVRRPSGIGAIFILLLLVLALATARPGDRRLYPARPGDVQAIWLIDNGFHTDLALPRAAIMAHGGPVAAAAAATSRDDWIMVGWGDARFYEATSPWQGRLVDAGRAALGGRPTTVHLEGVPTRPDLAFSSGVHRIVLSSAGLAALMARIDRSFALKAGAPIMLPVARQPDEAFFASGEGFNLFHVCNDWTSELLAAAGVPTTPVLDAIPAGLWLDLKLRAGL